VAAREEMNRMPNKALHLTAIPLRSIAAGELYRCRRAARDGNAGAKLTLDQQVADDVSRIVEVPGSRLIVACLLIRAAQPVAQALARVACDASRPPQPVPTLSSGVMQKKEGKG
jgi:hypothetical protein